MNCLLGGSNWSYDLRLPSHDQVHLPQVRDVREHREARCPLHSAAEHCQWKNLHFYLVLAAHTGTTHFSHFGNCYEKPDTMTIQALDQTGGPNKWKHMTIGPKIKKTDNQTIIYLIFLQNRSKCNIWLINELHVTLYTTYSSTFSLFQLTCQNWLYENWEE